MGAQAWENVSPEDAESFRYRRASARAAAKAIRQQARASAVTLPA